MALKFFLLAVLAVHAASASADAGTVQPKQFEIIGGYIDAAIHQLLSPVKKILQKIIAVPRKIVSGIAKVAKDVYAQATKQIRINIEIIKEKIKSMIEEAAAHKEKVDACVSAHDKEVAAHINTTRLANTECVLNATNAGQVVITEADSFATNITDKFQELFDAGKACSSLVSICAIELLQKIPKEVVNIPGEANGLFGKVTGFFTKTLPEVSKCVGTNMKAHNKVMDQAVDNVQKCIKALHDK